MAPGGVYFFNHAFCLNFIVRFLPQGKTLEEMNSSFGMPLWRLGRA